nr:(2Fe-2S)-binding protein [uncultured Halomonas sp.]
MNRRHFLKGTGVALGGAGVAFATAGATAFVSPANAASEDTARRNFPGSDMLTSVIVLNGVRTAATHEARVSLLDLLREQLELTGTKKGCNEGACGACTVLLDGERINACMTLAATCDGREVTTVEGLAGADGTLNAVQQAFIDQDAFQCGYCTPGQVISAVACIREGHTGSEAEIAEWMSGNICRCAAYPQIVAAVQQASKQMGA